MIMLSRPLMVLLLGCAVSIMALIVVLFAQRETQPAITLEFMTLTNDARLGTAGMFRLSNRSTMLVHATLPHFLKVGAWTFSNKTAVSAGVQPMDIGSRGDSAIFVAPVPKEGDQWRLRFLCVFDEDYLPPMSPMVLRIEKAAVRVPLIGVRVQQMLGRTKWIESKPFSVHVPNQSQEWPRGERRRPGIYPAPSLTHFSEFYRSAVTP